MGGDNGPLKQTCLDVYRGPHETPRRSRSCARPGGGQAKVSALQTRRDRRREWSPPQPDERPEDRAQVQEQGEPQAYLGGPGRNPAMDERGDEEAEAKEGSVLDQVIIHGRGQMRRALIAAAVTILAGSAQAQS